MSRASWLSKKKDGLFRSVANSNGGRLIISGLVIMASLPAFVSLQESGWIPGAPPEPSTHIPETAFENASPSSEVAWILDEDLGDSPEMDALPVAEFDCMIEPWAEISVRSPVIGRIDAMHVERADAIEEGQLLVELDAKLSKAELDVAEGRSNMTAAIGSLEARRSLESQRSERALELFSQNAMALDAKEAVLTEHEIAKFELQDARDQHSLSNLQLKHEQARYEQRRIRSPIKGIVAERLMSVGEVVDEETMLELAQIDPLRVEVVLPAIEFGRIQRGMKAAVIPEIPGDEVVVATVQVVDGIIDSASGTFGAELELPNADHAIPGGLRCRIRFMDAPVEAGLEPELETHAAFEPTEP